MFDLRCFVNCILSGPLCHGLLCLELFSNISLHCFAVLRRGLGDLRNTNLLTCCVVTLSDDLVEVWFVEVTPSMSMSSWIGCTFFRSHHQAARLPQKPGLNMDSITSPRTQTRESCARSPWLTLRRFRATSHAQFSVHELPQRRGLGGHAINTVDVNWNAATLPVAITRTLRSTSLHNQEITNRSNHWSCQRNSLERTPSTRTILHVLASMTDLAVSCRWLQLETAVTLTGVVLKATTVDVALLRQTLWDPQRLPTQPSLIWHSAGTETVLLHLHLAVRFLLSPSILSVLNSGLHCHGVSDGTVLERSSLRSSLLTLCKPGAGWLRNVSGSATMLWMDLPFPSWLGSCKCSALRATHSLLPLWEHGCTVGIDRDPPVWPSIQDDGGHQSASSCGLWSVELVLLSSGLVESSRGVGIWVYLNKKRKRKKEEKWRNLASHAKSLTISWVCRCLL